MELRDFKYIIVDGDSLIYKAAAVNQEKRWRTDDGKLFDEKKLLNAYLKTHTGCSLQGTEVDVGELSAAIDTFKEFYDYYPSEVCKLIYAGEPHRIFRADVATRSGYKGNRSSSDKPVLLSGLKEALAERGWTHEASLGLEVDDEVLWATKSLQEIYGMDSVILSCIDKDAKQMEGWIHNYNTGDIEYISKDEAYTNLMTQVLTGDTVDNIKGLFGVGPKSVHVKKLKDFKGDQEKFNSVAIQYEKHYNNYAKQFMLEAYRLLRMCITLDIEEPIREFEEKWKCYKTN